MASKGERATQAQRTLDYFEKADGKLAGLHKHALNASTLYTPEMLEKLPEAQNSFDTHYELTGESVMDAIIRLDREKAPAVGVLNFASARNPGGGFLNGSRAQEESLAASSNLYFIQTLPQNWVYYEINRQFSSTLYTDHMIFSRNTVFVTS